jgi:phosphohistidine phosphatase
MKRLIIMRHAKSDWNTDAPTDHARPLNKRGRRDAPRVAQRLAEIDWIPQYVISSDSARTRETFALMQPAFAEAPQIEFLATLYHAGPSELASVLAGVPDDFTSALALGHNPGWEEVVQWLTSEAITMTTGNAALVECKVDAWSDVVRHAGNWKLCDVIRPKEIAT